MLRSNTFTHSPPLDSSTYPTQPNNYPSVQSRHHAQLASYKRNPDKTTFKPASSLVLAAEGRRRSAVVENGAAKEEDKARPSAWQRLCRPHLSLVFASFIPFQHTRKRHVRNVLFYLFITLALYFIFLRPMSPPITSTDGLGSASGVSSHPTLGAQKVKHHKALTRATLPKQAYSTTDHHISQGLLLVNLESKIHPIYQLIRDAREAWDAKVQRQSRTLKAAVDEYRKRHRRNPPKGFDKWWHYVW